MSARVREESFSGDDESSSGQTRNEDRNAADAPSAPKRARRSGLKHISRACDACKSRKRRCDGTQPVCNACASHSIACTYEKEDKRKNRASVGDLQNRITDLVELLVNKGLSTSNLSTSVPVGASSITSSTSNLSSGTTVTNMAPSPGPTSVTQADMTSFLMDFQPQDIHPQTSTFHLPSSPLPVSSFPAANEVSCLPTNYYGGVDMSTGTSHSTGVLVQPSNADLTPVGNSLPISTSPKQASHTGDRLKRPEGGSFMQFGPTSLWSYTHDSESSKRSSDTDTRVLDLRPGDWVDWARPLPPGLDISKLTHDGALMYFGAYYAPWCMTVDMPSFLRDLDRCNLKTRVPPTDPIPVSTTAYSPLLHNCVLYLGLHLQRDRWPELAQAMDASMESHCTSLIMAETENPNTSTLLALTLFATCMNVRKDKSARNTGYIYFGMTFAASQALGVNLSCDHMVLSGQITSEERDVRNSTFWTIYQQDLLRAIAAGRPPMLRGDSDSELAPPAINHVSDLVAWRSQIPSKIGVANGLPALTSTVFHWTSRLFPLLRKVLDSPLYTLNIDARDRDLRVLAIAGELETWFRQQPFPVPTAHPVPHVLLMHMMYHLITIYLFRPYYRSELDITPSAADRCLHAANTTGIILRTYEAEHGLKNGVGTLIPIVFATATIQLLALVSSQTETPEYREQIQALDQSVSFIELLGPSWIEARRGLEVIKALRTEWLPGSDQSLSERQPPQTFNQAIPPFDQAETLPQDLHDWLLGTTFYDILNGESDLGNTLNM